MLPDEPEPLEVVDVPEELPPFQFFSRGLPEEDELELLDDLPGVLYVLPLQLLRNLLLGLAWK